MPYVLIKHATKVNAPTRVLWNLLVDKIRRPDKYITAVKDVSIVDDRAELQVERKMSLGDDTIREYITADEYTKTVVFKGLPGTGKRGYVINTIYEEPDGVYLEFVMNWDSASEMSQDKMQETLTATVEHTRELAEQQANEAA